MRRSFILVLALLHGCVWLPRSQMVYDEQCQQHRRQMTVEPVLLEGNLGGGCRDKDCLALLAAIGAIAAATFVVSTSIVAVQNSTYWVEKQAMCRLS